MSPLATRILPVHPTAIMWLIAEAPTANDVRAADTDAGFFILGGATPFCLDDLLFLDPKERQ